MEQREIVETELLEISPYQSDGGELIGRRPEALTSEVLAWLKAKKQPTKTIRAKCLDCAENKAEVRRCSFEASCSLWPMRFGTNPKGPKRRRPTAAIREFCLWCCFDKPDEVRKCVSTSCALWPMRFGVNPMRRE